MTDTVYVDIGPNQQMPVEVKPLGKAERARFLAMYPGDDGAITPNNLDQEHIDWLVEVTTSATDFTEGEIMSLSTYDLFGLCAKVATTALDVDNAGVSTNSGGGSGPTTVPTDDWMVIQ